MIKGKATIVLIFSILSAVNSFGQLPYIDRTESSAKLIVAGKPFLVLGGELHNSTGSDIESLEDVMKGLKALNLNTVLTYAYWELMEPVEGKFDFSHIDIAIEAARKENLKLIMLWLGSWKSTASIYAPEWVKTNPERFPRFTLEDGSTLEILSPFSEENRNADAKAYKALMRHIKEVDNDHIVIMTQVENEPGVFDHYRDYSKEALKVWNSSVPDDMIAYLKERKGKLFPALEKVWAENGNKTSGTWEEVFGKSTEKSEYKHYTEELFTAYHYSKYINYVTSEGRKELDLPAFCNAWLYNDRGFYPFGTCNPHVLDAYRAGGSALDFYSPNLYSHEFDKLFPQWTYGGNTLFIPEGGISPAAILYSIGEYNSIGYSPFGIDDAISRDPGEDINLRILKELYKTLGEMMDLITSNYGSDKMHGFYLTPGKTEQSVETGDYIITTKKPGGMSLDFGMSIEKIGQKQLNLEELFGAPVSKDSTKKQSSPLPPSFRGPEWRNGSALVIQTNKDEFIVVGYGLNLHFNMKGDIKFKNLGFLFIEEGYFINNQFFVKKRWNGDELKSTLPEDQLTILKIKLYHF